MRLPALALVVLLVATACPAPAPNQFTLQVAVEPLSFVVRGPSGEVLHSRAELEVEVTGSVVRRVRWDVLRLP